MSILSTGVTPAGMALDHNQLYVANNNNLGLTGADNVTVVDFCSCKTTTINDASFNQAYTITLSKTTAYVTNSNSSTITMIDRKTNTVSGVINGFDGPSGLVIFGGFGYVVNYGGPSGVGSGNGTTVSVFDLKTNLITQTITVPLAPSAIVSDCKNVYVISYGNGLPGTGSLSRIDPVTNTVTNTITGFFGPFGIALSTKSAFITNFGSNNFSPFGTTVSQVCLKTFTIKKTITLGIQPSGICIYKCKLYVSNYNTLYADQNDSILVPGEGTVSIINLKNTKKIKTVKVGQSPGYIVAGNGKVYVSNFTSNTISVLHA